MKPDIRDLFERKAQVKGMNIALILSGGTGTRLGADIPKQYIEVLGKPVIAYCMETLFRHKCVDIVYIVADYGWQEKIREWMESDKEILSFKKKFHGFSEPGENRQLSILNGMTDIQQYAKDTDLVLIHDAARPLLTERLITKCFEAAEGHDGVLPVLPMKDTIYGSSDGKRITSLLEREELFAGQAPEVFRLGKYYEANQKLLPERILKINGSAEPAVLAGMDVAMIPGDEGNFKITTKEDLERFREIVGK